MPGMLYPGDNFVPRAEAANLLTTGHLAFSYDQKSLLGDLGSPSHPRGQYFFEDDATQTFHSKYGIAYTLLYLPPLLLEWAWTGRMELVDVSQTLLVILNLCNLFIALAVATYLYKIISFYTVDWRVRIGFVLASIYTTFLWHYLRAPTLEIFLIAGFVGFTYHALSFLRSDRASMSPEQPGWVHLAVAVAFAGLLLLMKPLFALLFVALWLFAWSSGPAKLSLIDRFMRNGSDRRWKYLVHLVVPSCVAMALFLLANHVKFRVRIQHWLRAMD